MNSCRRKIPIEINSTEDTYRNLRAFKRCLCGSQFCGKDGRVIDES